MKTSHPPSRLVGPAAPRGRWLSLGSVFSCLLLSALAVRAQVPPSYTMTFDDEFNGTAVDTSMWGYRTDAKNYSQQLAANVSESGGYLHIAVQQQSSGGKSYTGGGLISLNQFGYGYYEASLEVPSGYGWHSSFWAMAYDGTDTSPSVADQELDFIENDSGSLTSYTSHYINWPTNYPSGHGAFGTPISSPNLHAGFNTLSCLFTPQGTTYYLNGVQTYTYNSSVWATNQANIWLTAIATDNPGTVPAGDEMLVDWVHYYAPSAAGSAPAAPTDVIVTSGSTQIALSWTAPLGASAYNVMRSLVSGGPYTTIASGITATTYTDTDVASGTDYYYVIGAENSASVASANSIEVIATPSGPGAIVMDNSDATGVTVSGAWDTSTYTSGYIGANYLQDQDAGGGKSVTYTPTIAESGSYKVYALWTSGSNRATNAPISIYDGTGTTTTVAVNQQANNGTWVSLGTFSFNAGTSGTVTISDTGANGYVVANGIEFVPADTVVMDNSDATGVTVSGAWDTSTYMSGYIGANYLQDQDAGGGLSVTYTPTILATGNYNVYALWTSGANRATNVPIDIYDATGTTTTVPPVNQTYNNGTWVLLGTFSFNAGTSGYVKIRDDGANGYVIANGIEFVPQ